MSGLPLLFLLLPLAALSGWYVARRGSERTSGARVSELSTNYFRGLNYLLNEQQDKAIEVFLKLAEFNRDTVETHLALGNLFRRRGEVDRAIRVHQNLIARPGLSDEEKTIALLELGEDYMRAGLLDRAETLFNDLVAMDALAPSALNHLIAICQHERDWGKAIEHAHKLERVTGETQVAVIAQFHCEIAEQARSRGDLDGARKAVHAAFAAQPESVRASIILGHLESQQGHLDAAIEAFERVAERDVDYVPEVLSPLLDCYARAGRMQRAEEFLLQINERYPGVSPVLALAKLYARTHGEPAAIEFLTRQLRQRPSVRALMALIEVNLHTAQGEVRENLLIQRDLTRKLLEGQAMYRCSRCGFGAKAHHWQCPSCKSWASVRPIHGVVGE
ncbi:MAG TPA: lipopolysaccharide assembly protein LapB [Dokdonella sp.]|uniref:lipopolysaccharide assembly protein LapB n=1 Tax=Dokdonella sp. TaxID=2291710 RepID=UPI0025BABDA7|nr:lipopolysaccharide assembly protein LapB [Dokdonella sp.]MBX3693187.1 lipopolysaccharide assembly protein LapB [Dokdonella sp.]MCW5568878.1 lipopolysaccharide assembly protein LapB [Dokdonella sp.]HNR91238.1 lipopolysaccharide assembly protein LapB [Dokdonella sp.]